MSEPLVWLDVETVVELHQEILEQFEGTPGLISRESLEGALARPRQYLAYRPDADIALLAASLCAGIIQDHAFLDGNKRTALDATFVWLASNGYQLNAPEAVDDTIVAVAQGTIDIEQLASLLSEWMTPLEPPS